MFKGLSIVNRVSKRFYSNSAFRRSDASAAAPELVLNLCTPHGRFISL